MYLYFTAIFYSSKTPDTFKMYASCYQLCALKHSNLKSALACKFFGFQKGVFTKEQAQRHTSLTVLAELISGAQQRFINGAHSPLIKVPPCQQLCLFRVLVALVCIAVCLQSKSRAHLVNLLFSLVQYFCSTGTKNSWFPASLHFIRSASRESYPGSEFAIFISNLLS